MNKNTTGCIFVVYWRRKMLCERSFRVRDNPFDNKTSWVTTKRVHSDSEIKHSMVTRIIRCKSKFIHFWNVRKRMTALCCRVIPQNGKNKIRVIFQWNAYIVKIVFPPRPAAFFPTPCPARTPKRSIRTNLNPLYSLIFFLPS